MGYTITKTTNGRFKINDGTADPQYIPASYVTLKTYEDTWVELWDLDFKIFRDYHYNITSPASTSIGNATFDYTAGALEDLWTKSTHGLSVGDSVIFTSVGTGASPYAVNTQYYVVNAPTIDTFQLSLTKGGAVLEGTADSAGTWTLKRYSAKDKAALIEAL